MFGGVNVWRIAELKAIGKIKFGEWIDFGHKVPLPAKIWLVKVWQIMHDSPNLPNFAAAKHSRYTVLRRNNFFVAQCSLLHKHHNIIIYTRIIKNLKFKMK